MFYADGSYTYTGASGVVKFYDAKGVGVVENPDETSEYIYTDSKGNTWGYDSTGNAFYKDGNGDKWSVDADGHSSYAAAASVGVVRR